MKRKEKSVNLEQCLVEVVRKVKNERISLINKS